MTSKPIAATRIVDDPSLKRQREDRARRVNWVDENGRYFMVYCPECGQENWAMAVASGECAWCGFKQREGEE